MSFVNGELMTMQNIPDHPEIQWIERTGYPSWMQDDSEYEKEKDENA